MSFELSIGTYTLILTNSAFLFIVRAVCKRDNLSDEIGIIDRIMLISLGIHIAWIVFVALYSQSGYQYLVWDDESYQKYAMGIYDDESVYDFNGYLLFLRWLYAIFGKTTFTGRLTNMFVSVATIYPLSTIEKRLSNKTLFHATKFYAYSPFMIFISCFEIKDIIVMFLFITAYAYVKRIQERFSLLSLIPLLIICYVNEQLRSGTGVLPITILVFSSISLSGSKRKYQEIINISCIVIILAAIYFVGQEYFTKGTDRIEKYQNWIQTQFSSGSIYDRLVVTKITDIWKFPLCFLLYTLQPLGLLSGDIRYLSDFGMIAKMIDVPVLFFSILFLPRYIAKERWNSLFLIVLYTFSSCINLTNARQGFFLYPIMYLVFFDRFLQNNISDDLQMGNNTDGKTLKWSWLVGGFYALWIVFVVYRLIVKI